MLTMKLSRYAAVLTFALASLMAFSGCNSEEPKVTPKPAPAPTPAPNPGGGTDNTKEDLFKPAGVELRLYRGHLHAPASNPAFHYVESPQGVTVTAFEQPITLTREGDNWKPKAGARDTWRTVKNAVDDQGLSTVVYGLWIFYKDAQGKDINEQIAAGDNDGLYQHFFSVSDVKPFGTDGVAEDGDNVTKNIIEYFYKDTEPFDKSHKENAKFIHAKNSRGLKGYFQFPRGFKSFTLNIELRKFASKEEKAKQVRAYDDNSAGQLVHKISVPVIIYAAAPNDALDHDDVFIADSPEDAIKFLEGTSEDALGNNEQGYPYKNILKNIMDAFGVDKRAVAIDGYYKGNGKAGDENGGLYF